jgi:hypothetical protein
VGAKRQNFQAYATPKLDLAIGKDGVAKVQALAERL